MLSHSIIKSPLARKNTHTFLTSSWRWSKDIPKYSDTPSDKEVIISSAHFPWRNPNLTGVCFNYQSDISDIMPHLGTLAKKYPNSFNLFPTDLNLFGSWGGRRLPILNHHLMKIWTRTPVRSHETTLGGFKVRRAAGLRYWTRWRRDWSCTSSRMINQYFKRTVEFNFCTAP